MKTIQCDCCEKHFPADEINNTDEHKYRHMIPWDYDYLCDECLYDMDGDIDYALTEEQLKYDYR